MSKIILKEINTLNDLVKNFEKSMRLAPSNSEPHLIDVTPEESKNFARFVQKYSVIVESIDQSEIKKKCQEDLGKIPLVKINKSSHHSVEQFMNNKRSTLLDSLLGLINIGYELSDHFSDHTVELRSAADIAFVHLQKSIIVNKVQKEEWESTWNDQSLETRFEKLGDSHLLSHNIWSAKFNTEGARTDLVLRDPTFETVIDPNDSKYKMSIGLLLTEWKVCREPKTVDKLIDGAIQQAKKYCIPHFGGFEFARLCYIVIVSKDYLKEMDTSDRLIEGITFRVVNIACIPSSPSKHAKKAHNT